MTGFTNYEEKDIIECKGTQTPMTISEGACEYRILELKIKPVRPITEGAVYGIEASFDDKDEDGEWVNFLRWNTDENSTYDVKDGWPEGVIDEYEGQGQWPYWSTYTYAPCYLASAPAEDEPASEEPASEEPASEEPASEEPASEEPASEEPASEPATQGSNTQPPKTADAGIVVAAVVMAAAAAVVLRKKH